MILTGSGEVVTIFEWDGIEPMFVPPGYITSSNTTESVSRDYSIYYGDNELDNTKMSGDLYGNVIGGNFYGNRAESLFSKTNILSVDGISVLSGETEITGSVNVSGDLVVKDRNVSDAIRRIDRTPYGALVFENAPSPEGIENPAGFCSFKLPRTLEGGPPNYWMMPSGVFTITLDQNAAIDVITNDDDYIDYSKNLEAIPGRLATFIKKYGSDPLDRGASFKYFSKLFDIINKGEPIVMIVRSVDWPNTFKKLKIVGGTYYTSDYRGLGLPNDYAKLNWGDNIFHQSFEVDLLNPGVSKTMWGQVNKTLLPNGILTASEILKFTEPINTNKSVELWPDYKDYIDTQHSGLLYSNYFNSTTGDYSDGFFELQVEEIQSNHDWYKPDTTSPLSKKLVKVPLYEQPRNGFYNEFENDLFWIDFEDAPIDTRKRKEVFEFETSTQWTVPSWADKITVYSIGAGGGGGGGSAGWIFNTELPPYEPYDDNKRIEFLINDWFGFEFATGGGGGAGGNIAISEFIIDKTGNNLSSTNIGQSLLPIDSKLNIFVGSGGAGGRGLTNDPDDYVNITVNALSNFYFNVINLPKISNMPPSEILFMYRLLGDINISYADSMDQKDYTKTNAIIKQFLSLLPYKQSEVGDNYFRVQLGNSETVGKDGGFSSVYLDASSNTIGNIPIELVKAQGGFGGMSGVSMQTEYNPYHRNCDFPYNHNIVTPKPLGGGASIVDSLGNIEVIPGGHGGMGVSMPDIAKAIETFYFSNRLFTTNLLDNIVQPPDGGIEANIANDIPMSKTTRKFKPPFGSIYKLSQGEVYQIDGYKKFENTSNIQNSKIAPLGGNGGLGVNKAGLENRQKDLIIDDVYEGTIVGSFEDKNGVVYQTMPNDWYKWISEKIQDAIIYGNQHRPKIIGNNSLILLTNVTAVNNLPIRNYEFRLKDSGALGGLDIYTRTDGTPVELTSVAPSERVPTQPENGLHYGQGGGGGAAAYTTNWNDRTIPIQAQNGGDGANGFVIIIAEEL